MTKEEKDLAWLLLQSDHYMIRTINCNGKEIYKVFQAGTRPVQYFTRAQVRRFSPLLKYDHKNKMTLNLSKVRQLNGKNYLKMLYKKHSGYEKGQEKIHIKDAKTISYASNKTIQHAD